MFHFLHLNVFAIGVRHYTQGEVLYFINPIPEGYIFPVFLKYFCDKTRFLTLVEWGLCWDHDGKSLSYQDKLSPGNNIKAIPHTIS